MSEVTVVVVEPTPTVLVVENGGSTIVNVIEDATVLQVAAVGVQGPPGPQGLPGTSAGVLIKENPIGDIDGANATFLTTGAFGSGTTLLYLNGLLQQTPDDYVEDPPGAVVFIDPPLAGDSIVIVYPMEEA